MTGNVRGAEDSIRRFNSARIVEHGLLIAIFAVLLVTGLSQKFHSLESAQWLIIHMGGIDAVRLMHRYSGIAFSILVSVHIAVGILGVGLFRWEPSMFIKKSDLTNAVHNIKYYLGLKEQPAPSDRYGYKQKFIYWSVLCGGVLMVCTGLILWFPITIVRFLPGEIVPTAKALHTNEALLIFLLVALWHIYDSIFSPDVFPLDKNIFTGRISRERMLREHPLELARISGGDPGDPPHPVEDNLPPQGNGN